MSEPKENRFDDLRRLASIEGWLGRLPFLPGDVGSSLRRSELNRERSEIVARLADKI